MRHNRRRRIDNSGSGKSVQLLSLSLFIMLLAFFIVLNAISSFEENRVDPIIGSLENTFSTATSQVAQRRPSVRPSQESEDFKGEGDAATLDRIRDLFRGRLAHITIKENSERGIMLIEVPYADFSTAIISMGQSVDTNNGSEVPFLPTLVTLLQTEQEERPYRMDMLLKTANDPVDMKLQQPALFTVTRDKVGKLSRRLSDAGVPEKLMSIGLRQGNENTLDLIFSPYEEIDVLKNREVEEEASPDE